MKRLSTFPFLLLATSLLAQPIDLGPAYKLLAEKALSHLRTDECQPCLDLYRQAFELSRHSALSHFRAAFCAHRCGNMPLRDSLLNAAACIDWSVCQSVMNQRWSYPEFDPLRGTEFEKEAWAEIRHNAEAAGVNWGLLEELEQIRYDDQKYRKAMDSVLYLHHRESPEFQAFAHDWELMDAVNLAKIEAIIARHGYPGKTLIGSSQGSTAWLVIQHAPLEKQEQYLPLIKEAADKGECRKSDWAYLLDRINMRKNLPQVYGSQVTSDPVTGAWVFHPIEDEANVNVRRAEVGLPPLEEYARTMGVDWKLPENKK